MLMESLLIAIFAGIAGIDLFDGLIHIHRPIVTGAVVGGLYWVILEWDL